MDCSMLGFPFLHHIPEFVHSHVQVSDAIQYFILCHPLLFLPLTFSSIRVFSNESSLHIRWPNYWSFSISPSSKYERLISYRFDWFDLITVQWTLKDLLQHYSSKASILWHSVFFMVQLSHPYMTTGKTSFDYSDLCQQSDVFLYVCHRFSSNKQVVTIHSDVLEPRKIKSVTASTFSPSIMLWSDGTGCHDFRFLIAEL